MLLKYLKEKLTNDKKQSTKDRYTEVMKYLKKDRESRK